MSYQVRSSRVVYDGALSRLRVDEVTMPGGGTAEREVAEHLDAVAVVAVDDTDHLVLVRQYRHPVGRYMLELPAGLLDSEGEDPAEAAHRELAEETGLAAEVLEELLSFRNSAGWTDEQTTVYLARDLRPVAAPDGFVAEHEEADMEIVRMPRQQAVEMAASGDLQDAKTLVGVLLADLRLRDRAL